MKHCISPSLPKSQGTLAGEGIGGRLEEDSMKQRPQDDRTAVFTEAVMDRMRFM